MDDRQARASSIWGAECWSSAFGPPPDGQGIDGHVFDMIPFHKTLVAGGGWQDLGEHPDLAATAPGIHGGDLIAAGDFASVGGRPGRYVARWDGANWYPLGSGIESKYFIPVSASPHKS
jgi:hypothetical protein